MQKRKSRAYYQYMLDVADHRIGYYSSDDISQIVYDLLDDGDTDEALAVCKKGLDQHPDDDLIAIIEAKVLARLHRYEECEQLWRNNADKDSPFGISIRYALQIHHEGGEVALAALLDDLREARLKPQEYIDIVEENFDEVDYSVISDYMIRAASLIMADKTSENADSIAEALGHIGAILMDCNCHRDAIPILEFALDIDAYDVYSWQDLSRCQLELKMNDECQQSCEMGLAIDPENPLFNFALGYILCERNEYKQAIPHLELAREYAEGRLQHENIHLDRQEMEQQRLVTYELLGAAYETCQQTDKAIECCQALLHRQPNVADRHSRMAILLSIQGNVEQAISYIDRAIALSPDETSYRALRVTMLTELRRYDEALAELDDLITLNPRSKTYLLAKAELSLSAKKFAQADSAYRALLKLHPKDDTSRQLMRAYFESIGDEEALKKLKR